MLFYLAEFLLFAFCGWIIDSVFSSITSKKWISSGYFPGVPLCPIYGFGGIIMFNSFALLNNQGALASIIITTFLVILLEYVGGWLAEHLLEEKLWDYSNEKWNFGGYISLWHSFLWLVLVGIVYFVLAHPINTLLAWLKAQLLINPSIEVLLTLTFVFIFLLLTFKTKEKRLKRLSLNKDFKSLEDMFDWQQWQRLTKKKRQELLERFEQNHLIQKLKDLEEKL
ncbi:MAG TPA: putative ABC transporter permease [Candidatus Woesebacteria bacterium]|nr:putative ABC transporter permease [Candidatus Woesebacteria bacterium]